MYENGVLQRNPFTDRHPDLNPNRHPHPADLYHDLQL